MLAGFWMLYVTENVQTKHQHFGGSAFALSDLGFDTKVTVYTGFIAVVVNLVVAVLATLLLRAAKTPDGVDATVEDDYHVDEGDPRVEPGSEPFPEPVTA
jgi:SSS family solute:Na+ symporter